MNYRSNEKGGVFTGLLIMIALIGGAVFYAAGHHFVMTSAGLKIYQKEALTLKNTYVDMQQVSGRDLGRHKDVIGVMASRGDLEYVPGGNTVERLMSAGKSVAESVERIDREYNVSSSAREVARIGREKYEQANEKYKIDEKVENARENMKEGANRLNNWLKNQ